MAKTPNPYTADYDLALIRQNGEEIELVPSGEERERIAQWLGAEGVESLTAEIHLAARGDEYVYTADFEADVVQACVVTLEPVRSHLRGKAERLYVVPASAQRRRTPPSHVPNLEIQLLDVEEPELLENSVVDLAAPVLEELSLALDPYPRAPGVQFEAPADAPGASDSPFAVLKQLKLGETDEH